MSFKPVYKAPTTYVNWSHLSRVVKDTAFLEQFQSKLDWTSLCYNEVATDLIKRNLRKIDYAVCCSSPQMAFIYEDERNHMFINWDLLSGNENAIPILERNLDKVSWIDLSANENAIAILECNLDKVNWRMLSGNENAAPILRRNLDKVDWNILSGNKGAIELLKANLDKVSWHSLSANPNAIDILEANMDKIDWGCLSMNANAVHILKANIDKISWPVILYNPNPEVIHILKQYPEKVNLYFASNSPHAAHLLFGYDYPRMMQKCMPFAEELAQFIFHANWGSKYAKEAGLDLAEYWEQI